MIQSLPKDFNVIGYNFKTTDETVWTIAEFEDRFELQSGEKIFPLMKLDGRFTLFASGYRNINLHGFDIEDVHYELAEVLQNENYVPVPVVDNSTALYAKERAFAYKLKEYATAFGIDIIALPEINITAMLQAAKDAGATETQIIGATTILLALTRDIEAEAGQVWADCWLALKSRLLGYLTE